MNFVVRLKGGLRKKGFTSHDVDFDMEIPTPWLDIEDEIFDVINKYGNIFYDRYRLELDIDFQYHKEFVYKLDRFGFSEV
jgi:hypothetical protein